MAFIPEEDGWPSWVGPSVRAPFSTRWRYLAYRSGLLRAGRCVCACAAGVKMASPGYPISSVRTRSSQISNGAPVLCLRLPSTPSFYTVQDQAIRLQGSICLLSVISDAAVFTSPSHVRDCSFDQLRPSGGSSHSAMARCWLHPGMFVGLCCCWCPETAAEC